MHRPSVVLTLLAALLGAGLLLGGGAPASGQGTAFSVLQTNLCLSGQAPCYHRATYPAVVDETVRTIRERHPDAVTVNEGCRRDVVEIAQRTGMAQRFAPVLVDGRPLRCTDPAGRGVFGIAVMTRDPAGSAVTGAFTDPAGSEGRRWLCVTTGRGVHVCTAHLDTRSSDPARRANDRECAELTGLLATYADLGPTVFGGDVNRLEPCAPPGLWAGEDSSASQSPGIQHVYATTSEATSRVDAARFTDHGYLDVSLRLNG